MAARHKCLLVSLNRSWNCVCTWLIFSVYIWETIARTEEHHITYYTYLKNPCGTYLDSGKYFTLVRIYMHRDWIIVHIYISRVFSQSFEQKNTVWIRNLSLFIKSFCIHTDTIYCGDFTSMCNICGNMHFPLKWLFTRKKL